MTPSPSKHIIPWSSRHAHWGLVRWDGSLEQGHLSVPIPRVHAQNSGHVQWDKSSGHACWASVCSFWFCSEEQQLQVQMAMLMPRVRLSRTLGIWAENHCSHSDQVQMAALMPRAPASRVSNSFGVSPPGACHMGQPTPAAPPWQHHCLQDLFCKYWLFSEWLKYKVLSTKISELSVSNQHEQHKSLEACIESASKINLKGSSTWRK